MKLAFLSPLRIKLLIGITALIIILLGVFGLRAYYSPETPWQSFASQGNAHITDLSAQHPPYNSNPPTSGWHSGELIPWGAYSYEVLERSLIHNMEDGGVILWYKAGSVEQNEAKVKKLAEAARGYRRTVITAREDLDTDYALTAWQKLYVFNEAEFDVTVIRAFLEEFEGIDHHR